MERRSKVEVWSGRVIVVRCSAFCYVLLMLMMTSVAGWAHTPPGKVILDSVELKGTEVRVAVRLIAEQSNMNIVVTNAAQNHRISLYLTNISAEQALAALCKIAGLWYRKDNSSQVYRVMTTAEYVQDVKVFQDYKTQIYALRFFNARNIVSAISDLYGDRVVASAGAGIELFSVDQFTGNSNGSGSSRNQNSSNNRKNSGSSAGGARASQLDRTIDLSPNQLEQLTAYLSGRPDSLTEAAYNEYAGDESLIYITLNQEHNKVLVRASEQQIFEDVSLLVEQLDVAVPQVLLEMKILSLGVDDNFRSLFNFDFQDGTEAVPNAAVTNIFDSGGVMSLAERAITLEAKQLLGVGNFPLVGGALTYRYINDRLTSHMELNKTDNDTRLLSAPIVMASNHRPARMFVGEEVVLRRGAQRETITPNDGPSRDIITIETEVREIGTVLEVVPRINQDRTITLAVKQESSSISAETRSIIIGGQDSSFEIPLDTVITTELEGTFIAKDGLTVAIGGLFKMNKSLLQSKVPLLGDIPVLGRLFRKEVQTDSVSELVLLITPHIIYDANSLEIASLNEVVNRNLSNPRDKIPRPSDAAMSNVGKADGSN